MATLSLVPTPSALETSTGSFHFLRSNANSAPNPPMPPSTPGVKVLLAWWRMRCFAASATAISTPASAYFIEVLLACVCRPGARDFWSFSFGRIVAAAGEGSTALLHFAGDNQLKKSGTISSNAPGPDAGARSRKQKSAREYGQAPKRLGGHRS